MILEQSTATITGNMTGAEYRAGVDDEDMGHIIGLFTDLYSDQEQAVLREYSTNARDAHIENGNSHEPILVSLPGPLSQFFQVQDFGIGLDEHGIKTIYSRYGRSTKRNTNDANGALGLGCKSALTYTDQFTVVSVKDGTKTICSITRSEGEVPVFTVVGSQPTTERNGTTVTVPTKRHTLFADKAAEFFSTWPEGSVLVDGVAPKPMEGMRLTDDILVQKFDSYYGNPHRVVMSGVTYPVDEQHFQPGLPRGYSLVMHVPNGSVNFTPSREALMYTKATRETLAGLKPVVKAAITNAVQREIDAADTPRAAIHVMKEWRGLMGGGTGVSGSIQADAFTWNSKKMPASICGPFTLTSRNSRKVGASNDSQWLSIELVPHTLFFEGWDIAKFTPTHKRKLLQFCEDQDIDLPETFALVHAGYTPDKTWIDPSQVYQWADVKAVKLPKTTVTSFGRPTGSYDVFLPGSVSASHVQAADLDTNEPIFYGRSMNRNGLRYYAQALHTYYPTASVVCVPENRFAKFMRNFPQAIAYRDGFVSAYKKWQSTLTKEQIEVIAMEDAGVRRTLMALTGTKVKDQKIRRAITLATITDISSLVAERREFSRYVALQENEIEWENPLTPYEMLFDNIEPAYTLRHATVQQQADFYTMLNALYEAKR